MNTLGCMFDGSQSSLDNKTLIDWLRLIRTENVGPVTFRNLLQHYGSAANALDALPELAKRGGRKRPIRICNKAQAERELSALQTRGITALALGTAGYPPALAAIDDAPPLLFARGHPALLERPTVAVVGARNASANGRKIARELGAELSRSGYLVVSGMARGIDGAAHDGALTGGTAAVLAGGVDVVFPPEHESLYEQIGNQGVVLAENPLGTVPQGRHFPRRNRIISGLAQGVVVVEAAIQSGSLITAQLGGEQGRDVMAVPGNPKDGRAAGCNKLLKQGAVLVEKTEDVVQALKDCTPPGPAERDTADFSGSRDVPDGALAPDATTLAEAQAAIVELMGFAPVPVDELIRECQFSPSIVTTVVLELELAGRCERHPGNRVALTEPDAA